MNRTYYDIETGPSPLPFGVQWSFDTGAVEVASVADGVSIAFRRSVVLRPGSTAENLTPSNRGLHCLSAFSGPSTERRQKIRDSRKRVSIAFRRSVVLRPLAATGVIDKEVCKSPLPFGVQWSFDTLIRSTP